MDNLNLRGSNDRQLISLTQKHEVRYWCTKWGIDEETLRSAVQEVGHRVEDVEAYLHEEGII